jgi:hypothetical protein
LLIDVRFQNERFSIRIQRYCRKARYFCARIGEHFAFARLLASVAGALRRLVASQFKVRARIDLNMLLQQFMAFVALEI